MINVLKNLFGKGEVQQSAVEIMGSINEQPTAFPGLDVSEGVERLMGNQDLYRTVLVCFAEDNRALMGSLKQACVAADLGQCRELVHSLKGSAASISANALSQQASELEKQVLADVPISDEAFTALQQGLDEVMSSIEQLMAEVQVEQPSRASAEATLSVDIDQQLAQLKVLVDSNDFSAESELLQLEASFQQLLGDEDLQTLKSALNQLNFSKAGRLLDGLIEQRSTL